MGRRITYNAKHLALLLGSPLRVFSTAWVFVQQIYELFVRKDHKNLRTDEMMDKALVSEMVFKWETTPESQSKKKKKSEKKKSETNKGEIEQETKLRGNMRTSEEDKEDEEENAAEIVFEEHDSLL